MPKLGLVNFNIVCAVLGGFVALFGLVSFVVKEKFYLSESCMSSPTRCKDSSVNLTSIVLSLLAGVLFGPAANWIRPREHALNDEVKLE
jgi:hypothetical protein